MSIFLYSQVDDKTTAQDIQHSEIKHPIILDYTLSLIIGMIILILGFFVGFITDNHLKTTSYNAKRKPVSTEIKLNSDSNDKYLVWVDEALKEYYKEISQLQKKYHSIKIKHADGQLHTIKFNIGPENPHSYLSGLLFKFEEAPRKGESTSKINSRRMKEDRSKRTKRSDLNLAEEFSTFLKVPEFSLLTYIFSFDPNQEKEYFKYLILDSCEKKNKNECLNAFKENIKKTLKLIVPDFQKP